MAELPVFMGAAQATGQPLRSGGRAAGRNGAGTDFRNCEVIPTAIHVCFRSGYNPIIRASAILISANKEQRGVSV